MFQTALYEKDAPRELTFEDGDWTGDGRFDSSDLIFLFANGRYEDGPKVGGDLEGDVADGL